MKRMVGGKRKVASIWAVVSEEEGVEDDGVARAQLRHGVVLLAREAKVLFIIWAGALMTLLFSSLRMEAATHFVCSSDLWPCLMLSSV